MRHLSGRLFNPTKTTRLRDTNRLKIIFKEKSSIAKQGRLYPMATCDMSPPIKLDALITLCEFHYNEIIFKSNHRCS